MTLNRRLKSGEVVKMGETIRFVTGEIGLPSIKTAHQSRRPEVRSRRTRKPKKNVCAFTPETLFAAVELHRVQVDTPANTAYKPNKI